MTGTQPPTKPILTTDTIYRRADATSPADRTRLTREQQRVLLRPINPSRVAQDDAGFSHLQAWDVRAHLIRVFGFGTWSADLLTIDFMYEQETTTRAGKPAWKVGYRAVVRLTLHDTGATYTEAAAGEAILPDFKRGDAHDMAIKTAESQALKRCATNLGTQFGLSLYDNGNVHDVVRGVLGLNLDADEVPS